MWHIQRDLEEGGVQWLESSHDYKEITERCERLNRRTHETLNWYVAGKEMPVDPKEKKPFPMFGQDGKVGTAVIESFNWSFQSGEVFIPNRS